MIPVMQITKIFNEQVLIHYKKNRGNDKEFLHRIGIYKRDQMKILRLKSITAEISIYRRALRKKLENLEKSTRYIF